MNESGEEIGIFLEVKTYLPFAPFLIIEKCKKPSVFCIKRNNHPYFSDEFGLHLVLGRVEEESYAYQCGIREGDIIVYVNGWLITVMDKPQVGGHNREAEFNVKMFRLP